MRIKQLGCLIISMSILALVTGCEDYLVLAKHPPEKYFQGHPDLIDLGKLAYANKRIEAIALIDKKNININEQVDRFTLLRWMAFSIKTLDGVKLLLDLGADPNYKLKNMNGESVMFFAAVNPETEILRLLLEKGGNENITSVGDGPLLCTTIRRSRWDNMTLLLEYGADPNFMGKPALDSALMCAGAVGRYDKAFELLEKGGDPKKKNKYGNDMTYILNLPTGSTSPWKLQFAKEIKRRGMVVSEELMDKIRKAYK